jgi:TonB family protein
MAGQRDSARYASDVTALALTGAAAAIVLLSSRHLLDDLQREQAARSDRAIELTLQAPEAAPAPPPPQPPPPRPRRAKVIPAPAPVAVPPEPAPTTQEPAPPDAALIAPAAPAPAATGSRPDLEAQYAAALRADIDRRTHPPQSAQYRLRHPSGEVRVRFVVTRGGEVNAVTLLRSSGSRVLDEEALETVSSGHYPPMPEKAFVGEMKHTFVVTIEFRALPVARQATGSERTAA